ncbi:C40 family peptidase [Alkalibacter mobilis]|uniref:hypothetical protein n=1 Tax=Alkalibacter mobilis TaxID=2787712 RepID=UPI0018A0C7D8|nr:hypothetical protein [Alkalibacter mobilis]MBF7096411.1 hypothetical protein [Alkalibacter mobilis]
MKTSYRLYILLTDTGTVLNRLIKMYTKDPYNHVSIGFDKELKDLYSFGRKKTNNPIIGGFVKENINSGILSNANCAVYEMDFISPIQYWKVREYIKQFELNRDNYRYNLLGLFGVMFNINIERCDAFFCSQFVASVFEYSKIPLFNKPCVFVTPGDFLESPALRLVYTGKMCDYRHFISIGGGTKKLNFIDDIPSPDLAGLLQSN